MGIAERNQQAAEPFLEPDEQVQASCAVQLKGTSAFMAFGALGVLLGGLFNKKPRLAAEAAGLPIGAYGSNLVVTDRRLLVLKGKKLLASVPGAQLRAAELVGAKVNTALRIDMANGHSVNVIASRVFKPGVFVAALNTLAGGPIP